MRSLALNPCASDGTNKRPQTIAAGWKNTNQNRVQEKNLRVYWIVFWLSFGRKYQHYYLFEILTCWAFFKKMQKERWTLFSNQWEQALAENKEILFKGDLNLDFLN